MTDTPRVASCDSHNIPGLAAELARETARAREAAERVDRALAGRREAEIERFARAEAMWLRAVLDCLDHGLADYGDDAVLDQARRLSKTEAAAWRVFLRTPAPTVADLSRKVLAIERLATEVAQNEAEPHALIEGLAHLRADLLRLARA